MPGNEDIYIERLEVLNGSCFLSFQEVSHTTQAFAGLFFFGGAQPFMIFTPAWLCTLGSSR